MEPSITIAICTYKRPYLKNTIDSVIRSLESVDFAVNILIVDNDINQTGRHIVEQFDDNLKILIEYEVEEIPGVVNARNRVLQCVKTKWLITLDDDEYVDLTWFNGYLELINSGVVFDAAVSPVVTTYPAYVNHIIKDSGILDRKEVNHLQVINYGATGNSLINMERVREHNLTFDPIFNETGGEDSDFFERLSKFGIVIWNQHSIAYEPLAKERSSEEWVLSRLFNNGRNYGFRQITRKGNSYRVYLFFSSVIKFFQHSVLCLNYFVINKNAKYFNVKCELHRDLGRIYSCFNGL